MKEQVLQAMREAGKPVSAGDVTKALNADRKEVDVPSCHPSAANGNLPSKPLATRHQIEVHQMTSWCTFCVFEEDSVSLQLVTKTGL